MRYPADLGLPSRFSVWRPNQLDAILEASSSPSRFVGLCQPTGSGKSLTAMAISRLLDARTLYLTSTKGLQNQLRSDFPYLEDVRGQANYACELDRELRVSEGPCHEGMSCHLKQDGCTYYDAVRRVKGSRYALTNYAYWLTMYGWGDGLGDFDLLICDEGHAAPKEIAEAVSVRLSAEERRIIRRDPPATGWKEWAAEAIDRIKRASSWQDNGSPAAELRRKAKARGAEMKLKRLSEADEAEWIMSEEAGDPRWDPITPASYAHHLFQKVAKVVLVSATIRPKTMELLGLGPSSYSFLDYPSTFDLENRPVVWIPTARIDRRATPAHYQAWIDRGDEIIKGRLDRKGIWHTVSYDRAKLVMESSRYSSIMLFHDRHTARSVVERFKSAPAPCILVSPSMSTGYDFPYDACRYQIIGKVAFPDTRAPVMRARCKRDKEYASFLAMTDLIQAAGRGVRAEDDWCETFILDDNVQWFMNKFGKFAPRWFKDAYRKKKFVPDPPPID